MGKGGIGLTRHKWNPVTGCTKYSEGCAHCYALDRIIPKLQESSPKYRNGNAVTCHEDLLNVPKGIKEPTTFFVNGMADVFHDRVPFSFLEEMFRVMNETSRHMYYVQTKRVPRLLELAPRVKWTPNIWIGITVESRKYVWRIDELRKVPARRKYVMNEPLLDDLGKLDLTGIDFVLVGGESGIGFRPMDISWARNIRDQCIEQGVMFNFMQYAAIDPVPVGRLLDGKLWTDVPRHENPDQLSLFEIDDCVKQHACGSSTMAPTKEI